MLVLYNLRFGLYHSLTNRLAEGLLSAGTILVTGGSAQGRHKPCPRGVQSEPTGGRYQRQSQQKKELDSHLTGRVENGPGSRVEVHLVEGRGVSAKCQRTHEDHPSCSVPSVCVYTCSWCRRIRRTPYRAVVRSRLPLQFPGSQSLTAWSHELLTGRLLTADLSSTSWPCHIDSP